MGCIMEFTEAESLVQIEFCSDGNKQKILIDVLIKYSGMDMSELASVLGVSVKKLRNIYDGKSFLVGKSADSLAQLFLRFFGQQFFRKFTLIRNFVK